MMPRYAHVYTGAYLEGVRGSPCNLQIMHHGEHHFNVKAFPGLFYIVYFIILWLASLARYYVVKYYHTNEIKYHRFMCNVPSLPFDNLKYFYVHITWEMQDHISLI